MILDANYSYLESRWSAVVRYVIPSMEPISHCSEQLNADHSSGAVTRGLEGNQVENRKSRCHYGVVCRAWFDPTVHSDQEPVWCPLEEKWKVANHMKWFIEKVRSYIVDTLQYFLTLDSLVLTG